MQSKFEYFFEILASVLVIGCLFNPAAAAFAFLVICSARIADKYFTRNISDKDREEIQNVKSECAKLKIKVEHDSISKAFSR